MDVDPIDRSSFAPHFEPVLTFGPCRHSKCAAPFADTQGVVSFPHHLLCIAMLEGRPQLVRQSEHEDGSRGPSPNPLRAADFSDASRFFLILFLPLVMPR